MISKVTKQQIAPGLKLSYLVGFVFLVSLVGCNNMHSEPEQDGPPSGSVDPLKYLSLFLNQNSKIPDIIPQLIWCVVNVTMSCKVIMAILNGGLLPGMVKNFIIKRHRLVRIQYVCLYGCE